MTAADGAWDQFLKERNRSSAFTLTRVNYDAQARLLIPRAVAYSAGLIDYFFRGNLEVQDAGYTDDGVMLRVRNAIDPKTQEYWKDESLNGGQMVVTLRYESPNLILSGSSIHHHTSDPVTLTEELKPGHASWAAFEFKNLSVPPDNATKIEYRLVYRGPLGKESDAIAVATFKPVSGFLVTPDYAPADGLSSWRQQRLIYYTDGKWHLSKDMSFKAGNIDWKGWYVNGKPTKVLSWVGPRARYFPDLEVCERYRMPSGFYRCKWNSSSTMYNEIYQGGVVLAVAPSPVLATAVVRDTRNEDWLVVVVKDGNADVIYRRPYQRSDSSALYDEVNDPQGWRKIGEYFASDAPGASIDHHADIPWFFSGDGREAQTMRRWWDISAGDITQRLKRLRLTIDADVTNATVTDQGNTAGIQSSRCSANYDADGAGSAQTAASDTGSTVIAVDYKDATETLATVHWRRESQGSSTVTVTKATDPDTGTQYVVSADGSKTVASADHEWLQWGGQQLDIVRDEKTWRAEWQGPSPDSAWIYKRKDEVKVYELEIAYYLDLRQDFFSFYELSWDESEEYSSTGPTTPGRGNFAEAHRIVRASSSGPELTPYRYSNTYTFRPSRSSPWSYAIYCGSSSNPPPTASYGYNFGWFWDFRVGGWAIDTGNRAVISQQIYGDFGYSDQDPYSYIDGGDLKTIIPGASGITPPVYYPISIVR